MWPERKWARIYIGLEEPSDHNESSILREGGTSQIVLVVKNLPANARDAGLIPGLGRSPGGGKGYSLQYSGLENPMGRGAWWAIAHSVTKSWTQLK